ncbi:hypothetical protein IQ268_12840 [Oculatella sp. LEGE 06141]|uniref:hypothetical protein n=1 Tax=Oculatella sp. LEGE 06141 TaxID=1828648 RepID=UPI00187F4339|nr:hypothetical protein [Oculatella sp. LEGE 06141]MBE9179449.1 hypothetical protein [Oculatella sp. LEGE 06141]
MQTMNLSRNYVLVLGQQCDDLRMLESSLAQLSCPLVFAHSMDQVTFNTEQSTPALVILAGSRHEWSDLLVNGLRHLADACGTTIVALTDCNAPSWLEQEDNPGLDGFLVRPLTGDVLTSLVQSAWVRRACHTS